MAPTRADLTLLGVVAVIAIGAVVAVRLAHPETTVDPGTPEATVQDLLRATGSRDPAALELIDPGLGCTERDVEFAWMPRDLRVDLLDVAVTGDTALVRVDVVQDPGGDTIFGVDRGYVRTESFELARTGGAWLVTGLTWPLWCEGSHR